MTTIIQDMSYIELKKQYEVFKRYTSKDDEDIHPGCINGQIITEIKIRDKQILRDKKINEILK